MDHSAGDFLRERYRLEERVGAGGFSTVWRATDREGSRPVALKLPRVGTHEEAEVLRRFERERQLLEPFGRGLSHATVVRYVDGVLETEPRFLAFEYLSGDVLVDAFGTGTLGRGVRRRVATDLAETLDFLHRNDIVYLDLKPENVILRRSGGPVLIDFNAALSRSESPRTVFEPDQFKAPELLSERRTASVGPVTDVYSWGKLAFYLLSGVKVLTEDVPASGLDPRDHGSTVDPGLATAIQRATRPDPAERFDDGPALAAAVARATGREARLPLIHGDTGVCGVVRDGDTIGAPAGNGLSAWLTLADPREHVASRHARLQYTGDGWQLQDTSVNGTYVRAGERWRVALSERGYDRQVETGALDPDDPTPPTSVPVPRNAVIAPVHPEYGIALRVG